MIFDPSKPTLYVRSGAAGLGDGSSWVNAFTSFKAATLAWDGTTQIAVAVDHDESSIAGGTAWYLETFTYSNATNLCYVISVDHNTNLYSPAVTGQFLATNRIYWRGSYAIYGINMESTLYIDVNYSNHAFYLEDTRVRVSNAFYLGSLSHVVTVNCDIEAAYIQNPSVTYQEHHNTKFRSITGIPYDYYFRVGQTANAFKFKNCDFSDVVLNVGGKILTNPSGPQYYSAQVHAYNCKGVNYEFGDTFPSLPCDFVEIGTDFKDQFRRVFGYGKVLTDQGVYRNEGYYDRIGSFNGSMRIQTFNTLREYLPMWEQGHVLSGGTYTMTVYINSQSVLSDGDLAVLCRYDDGLGGGLDTKVQSAVLLPGNAADWTGAQNVYEIQVTFTCVTTFVQWYLMCKRPGIIFWLDVKPSIVQ